MRYHSTIDDFLELFWAQEGVKGAIDLIKNIKEEQYLVRLEALSSLLSYVGQPAVEPIELALASTDLTVEQRKALIDALEAIQQ